MKTIERAKETYETYGKPMILERFPEYAPRIAAGLAGHGSECFGFDDEVSMDHDVDNGFCLWLTDGDFDRIGAELERAYLSLPLDARGAVSEFSGKARGVMRISDYYRAYTGSAGAPTSWRQWLAVPSWALAEASNGQVWDDPLGAFSREREQILRGMPEDVLLKKMAARAALMAQTGQYNYARCLSHGEEGAAMLALSDFVREACGMIYLLNGAHCPYYKWMLKGMEALPALGEYRFALEHLLTGPNDGDGRQLKKDLVEDVCLGVIRELQKRGLTSGNWDYLEPHAYSVAERIRDPEIRSLHIMEG